MPQGVLSLTCNRLINCYIDSGYRIDILCNILVSNNEWRGGSGTLLDWFMWPLFTITSDMEQL